MANYKKVAEQILSTVGGAENVASVTHCMTRLRFNLKDESLSNDEKLEDISSIISVVHAGGQVQLVVGPTVDKVYDEVCKQGGFEVTVSIDEELDGPQLSWKERLAPKHLFNQLLDAVSGAITPILPIFCVAGIFKMLVILFGPEGAGFMSETSDLYRILSLVGDAAYYYFPVFAAYSSAKKFKTSPVLALLIAVVMIYPDMLVIVEDGKPFSVFGIPMQLVNYTQAVLPVILITWAQSYVERFFKKISPDMLRILIVPVGTVLVMLPVALCLCGPAVQFVMGLVADFIIWLASVAGPAATAVIGAFWNLIIATGMHVPIYTAILPAALQNGYDAILYPGTAVVAYTTLAIALAYGLRTKDKESRATGWNLFITYAFGRVSEPIIYGILFRNKKALAWNMIGGAVGGLLVSLLHANVYIFTGVGFPWMNVLMFAQDIIPGTIGCLAGGAVTFALAMIFGFEGQEKMPLKSKSGDSEAVESVEA